MKTNGFGVIELLITLSAVLIIGAGVWVAMTQKPAEPESPTQEETATGPYWYVAVLTSKAEFSDIYDIDTQAYLRRPIANALGISETETIKKVVVNRSINVPTDEFYDMTYYLQTENPLVPQEYESEHLIVNIEKLEDASLLPYLENNDYCEIDSDCSARNAFTCTYGVYNHFESINDFTYGCEQEFRDGETDTMLSTECTLTFNTIKCVENSCVGLGREVSPTEICQ